MSWVREAVRRLIGQAPLSPAARRELRRDREGVPADDPGMDAVVRASTSWIAQAQDLSRSADGGVAAFYGLRNGWAPSYPETTGYIVPTMLEYARRRGDGEARDRARTMLDWLVSIQMASGAFQGGFITSRPVAPVTFNTGQILLGLSAGVSEFGGVYEAPMKAAADWLVETQDDDGCWRSFPSPFTVPGEKTYETHVAWALLEADRVRPGHGYGEAGLANVRWAVSHQEESGWYRQCCLDDPSAPLTHTIGYALRGCLEGYRFSPNQELLDACRRAADGLLSALSGEGRLPGRLDRDWRGTVDWDCITGTAQVASCWFLLYDIVNETKYLEAARKANRFVRRTIRMDGGPGQVGGVKGSYPVNGDYEPYRLLNWAAKFTIDAQFHELDADGSVKRPARVGAKSGVEADSD